ncbi:MAG: peptide chain release factor N(5)-glutamine methyltransferase [Tepidisphaeraceae bacterium]
MGQTDGPWTVERVLTWTRGYFERRQVDSPRLCAELLMAHVLELPRIKLYTNYQQVLSDAQLTQLRELVKRAGEEEPIAYLTGRAHFFNLEFDVNRDVLIPRPDTETLVEHVMQLSRNVLGFESPRVLDLCTGSGCVAVAIAFHLKTAHVVASDISERALVVASQNVQKHGVGDRVTLVQGDLYDGVAGMVDPTPFDVIVANPPYIATNQMASLPRNVKDYEPHLALDGGADGLDPHRRILQGTDRWLRDGGRVMMEIAFDQKEAALEMASQFPKLSDVKVIHDYSGNPRILLATKGTAE